MKITVYNVSTYEQDCDRRDYFTIVDGHAVILSPSSLPLPNQSTLEDIQESAKRRFGDDVELAFNDSFVIPEHK